MTSLAFLALLGKPMPERLAAFRQEPQSAYKLLTQTAFDSSQSLQARWRSLTSMGSLDPKYFLKILESALRSKEWHVRNAALISILNEPRDIALKWSTLALNDPALMVRTQAVRNLVGLEAEESEPLLWRQIWDARNFRGRESLWIRAHIAEALARLPGRGRVKDFQKLIMDPDSRLHKWAIMGLEKSTGLQLSRKGEAIEVQRQKWLARLGVGII